MGYKAADSSGLVERAWYDGDEIENFKFSETERDADMQRMTSNLENTQRGSQLSSAVVTAVILFALSGLMVGFAYRAFTRPQNSGPQPTSITETTPTPTATQKAVTPTATAIPQDIALGCPKINTGSIPQDQALELSAATSMTYEMSIQATDKANYASSGNQKCQFRENTSIPKGQPVKSKGLICKLLLVEGNLDNNSEKMNGWGSYVKDKKVDDLKNPFPNEIGNALVFDQSTPQLQPCKDGLGKWKFTFAPNVLKPNTTYFLVGYTQIFNYNWNWTLFTTSKN